MAFNKTKEASELKNYIIEKVDSYSSDKKIGYIQFGFEADQGGIISVFFDTRKDAEPDGSWTMNLDGNCLKRNHWPDICEEMGAGELVNTIGDLIKDVVLDLRKDSYFEKLPKHSGCQLGIEEMNGDYGWPIWEERGKENVA